jgi:hypothetical protein
MLHHYTRYCDAEVFDEAFDCLKRNIEVYGETKPKKPTPSQQRYAPKQVKPPNYKTSNQPLSAIGVGRRQKFSRRTQPRSTR